MNSDISFAYWIRYFGWLSFQMLLIGGIVGILSKFLMSARMQVTLYRGAMLSLLFLVVASFLGFNQINLRMPSSMPEHNIQPSITAKPIKEWHTTDNNSAISTPTRGYNITNKQSVHQNTTDLWFPIWIWVIGSMVQLLRMVIFQQRILRIRSIVKVDTSLETMIHRLSTLLKLKQIPQIVCIPELSTPVALGWRKPIIGIPMNFTCQFTEPQQRVVLLHELAHIKAQDPLWHLISNLITAISWWHPVSWWMQRRTDHASEIAADEASQLLDEGATTLAECLVMLGNSNSLSIKQAWISIAGNRFKSGLAQRVYRLLNLKRDNWYFGAEKLRGIMAAESILLCSISIFFASCFIPKSVAGTPPINLSSSLAGKMLAALAADKALDSKTAQEELRSYRIDQPMMNEFFEKHGIKFSDSEDRTSNSMFEKYFEAGGLRLSKGNYVYHQLMGCVRASTKILNAMEKELGLSPFEANPIANDTKASVISRIYKVTPGIFHDMLDQKFMRLNINRPLRNHIPIPNVESWVPQFFNELLGMTSSEGDPQWNPTLEDLSKAARKDPRGQYIVIRYNYDYCVTMAVRGTESQLNLIQQVLSILNAKLIAIRIESKFLEVPENIAQTVEFLKTGTGGTNLLTSGQYRELIHQLDQSEGIDIMSAPGVTTLNGRGAQLSIIQTQQIVFPENMDFHPFKRTESAKIQTEHPFNDLRVTELTYPEVNTNSPINLKKTYTGIGVEVIPVALTDNWYRITMNPIITDFLGYIESDKDKKLQRPKFRIFQTSIKTTLGEDQALIIMYILASSLLSPGWLLLTFIPSHIRSIRLSIILNRGPK